jgi:hypothetical protein
MAMAMVMVMVMSMTWLRIRARQPRCCSRILRVENVQTQRLTQVVVDVVIDDYDGDDDDCYNTSRSAAETHSTVVWQMRMTRSKWEVEVEATATCTFHHNTTQHNTTQHNTNSAP